ncbi:MAG: pilus assembly protein TadG-related protein [Actinomycetota bacterium]
MFHVRRLLREEAAGITVVTAALVPVMLLFVLALHDVAMIYAARSQAQTAADAAAKAAGLELTPLFGVGNDPAGAARDYTRRNGCELLSCERGGNGRYMWVTIRVARRADRLFLRPGGAVLTATARCYLDLSRGGLSSNGSETMLQAEQQE